MMYIIGETGTVIWRDFAIAVSIAYYFTESCGVFFDNVVYYTD